jgi:N-acetylmuramoyl-L-alanine amidase
MMGIFTRSLAGMALAMLTSLAVAQDFSALARLDPAASSLRDGRDAIDLSLAISQPVPFRVSLRDNPPRLVVDFREVDFGAAKATDLDQSDRVRALNWGRFRPGWSRLVAELDGPYRVAEAAERTEGAPGAEIRVRLIPTSGQDFASRAAAVTEEGWALPKPAPVDAPKRRQTGEVPLVVVLDPGHGGIDPGAEAEDAVEAQVMLTFARELAEVLRRAGMTVVMTREEDVFVPLETRISVARAAGADVFLSLHADALAEGEARGATIYKLAETASDAATAQLAERHDRADLLAGVDLEQQDDIVASVLMGMVRLETQPRTDRLADAMADAMRTAGIRLHSHPIQAGAFSVLKAPDIPALLIELGFLSSPDDRKRLNDAEWRSGMQAAILKALQDWAIDDAAEARLIRQ